MEGLTLLREAQEAGLRIAVVGDSLEIVGPKSAAPIVERIRQRKAEIMAALGAPCCPGCVRRAGPGDGPDGELVSLLWQPRAVRGAGV